MRLSIRVTPEEFDLLHKCAGLRDATLTAYVIYLVMADAELLLKGGDNHAETVFSDLGPQRHASEL